MKKVLSPISETKMSDVACTKAESPAWPTVARLDACAAAGTSASAPSPSSGSSLRTAGQCASSSWAGGNSDATTGRGGAAERGASDGRKLLCASEE